MIRERGSAKVLTQTIVLLSILLIALLIALRFYFGQLKTFTEPFLLVHYSL
jgi:preprotein translocase subunit SecG